MTANLRAPGWYRAGAFLALGVLFCAALVTAIRLAYGFSTPFDGSDGWNANWQDAVLIVSMVGAPLFFLVGGLLAMLVRAELAAPGSQFVDSNAYNGLFSVHASLMIFLFIIPVFAGLANYVLPLMI